MKKKSCAPAIPRSKGIVFVKGSWYDMGMQYGSSAKNAVKVKCIKGKEKYLDEIRRDKAAAEKLRQSFKLLEEKAPEMKALWKGIARGAGLRFSDVVKAYVDFRTTDMHCSNISAWGKATADHKVKCGMNCDEKELVNYYAPTVIAYPKKGYPFISASAFTCNCVMNNQGLVIMASCGENALPEDVKAGLPNCLSLILCAAECKTAEEAKNKILAEKLGPGGGENIHIADKTGSAFVIEHTAARDQVRVSGYDKENDYLVAANHFITREMDLSNFSGKENQIWMNSYFRYWTEKHMLEEAYGEITLDVLNRILGSNSFWGETSAILEKRGWTVPEKIKKGWNFIKSDDDERTIYEMGKFSPEIRTQEQKCVFSALMCPEDREFYLLNGCRNKNMSLNPWATGIFTKIKLEKSIRSVVDFIQEEAGRRIFKCAWKGKRGKAAKICYTEGVYWKSKAICAGRKNKGLLFWGYSATAFLKAQEYSYMTVKEVKYDEPEKISI